MAEITIPTALWATSCSSSLPRGVSGRGGTYYRYWWGPALVTDEEEVHIDDFLDQITHGHNSTVMHGKLTSLNPQYSSKDIAVISSLPRYSNYPYAFEAGQTFLGFNSSFSLDWTDEEEYQAGYSRRYVQEVSYGDGKPEPKKLAWTKIHFQIGNSRQSDYSMHDLNMSYEEFYWPEAKPVPGQRVNFTGYRAVVNRYNLPGSFRSVDISELREEIISLAHLRVSTQAAFFNYHLEGLTPDLQWLPNPALFSCNERSVLKGCGKWPEQIMMGLQDAFVDAGSKFAKAADNNIENLKDLVELVVDFYTMQFDSVPKNAADLWMFWRYCWNTTRSDIKQAMRNKLDQAVSYYKPKHYYGESTVSGAAFGTTDISVKCGFDVVLNSANFGAMLTHWDYYYGMEITAATLYDLIPFSFVADWFTGWGDSLHGADELRHLQNDYVVSNCVYSLKYERERDYGSTRHYTRWYQNPPSLENYVWHSDYNPSNATWLKRGVDASVMLSNSVL